MPCIMLNVDLAYIVLVLPDNHRHYNNQIYIAHLVRTDFLSGSSKCTR